MRTSAVIPSLPGISINELCLEFVQLYIEFGILALMSSALNFYNVHEYPWRCAGVRPDVAKQGKIRQLNR